MPKRENATWDCVVVGGGAAGLTAAVYLARFRRRVMVIDAYASRARYIPTSHNCPGFPDGISGLDLLATLRRHARNFDAKVTRGTVTSMRRERGSFELKMKRRTFHAKTVLLATGIVDLLPNVSGTRAAIRRGVMRLCPICDGFEASDGRIAVLGPASTVVGHAKFLRAYSDRVTAVLSEATTPSVRNRAIARRHGIAILEYPNAIRLTASGCRIRNEQGDHQFDCLYPALGFKPKCRLASDIAARVDRHGEILVSRHMQTSIPGLFAAGDCVSGLHQISVATGQAAVAATAIHNYLP